MQVRWFQPGGPQIFHITKPQHAIRCRFHNSFEDVINSFHEEINGSLNTYFANTGLFLPPKSCLKQSNAPKSNKVVVSLPNYDMKSIFKRAGSIITNPMQNFKPPKKCYTVFIDIVYIITSLDTHFRIKL